MVSTRILGNRGVDSSAGTFLANEEATILGPVKDFSCYVKEKGRL